MKKEDEQIKKYEQLKRRNKRKLKLNEHVHERYNRKTKEEEVGDGFQFK